MSETISKNLSLRLSLLVVCEVLVLLFLSLGVMFYFSRHALKEEALLDAEQTLEGTVQHIDNVLLSVEQSTGNFYWDILAHLDQPELMYEYSRQIVACNPHIVGCAIVFKPDYYPGHHLFMAYVRRANTNTQHPSPNTQHPTPTTQLETRETFTDRPYTEQVWYTEPMKTKRALWTDPLKNEYTEDEPLISFCLPIYDRDTTCVGVVAVDVPISLLSQIVMAAKPSPNAYITLLGRNGSYIIHPDSEKLMKKTVTEIEYATPSMKKAAEAMMAGETGEKSFRMNREDWYVFYKPFIRNEVVGRSNDSLGWSVGVVYPEDDIFEAYNQLIYYVLGIAIVGLLLLFVFCRIITNRQLQPLRHLRHSTQRIAQGFYDDDEEELEGDGEQKEITKYREDEIGQLQDHFQQMQQSLSVHMGELENLSASQQERSKVLRKAFDQAKDADRMKTTFLHYMTNQMTIPSDAIDRSITTLCNNYHNISMQEVEHNVDTILQQSNAIIDVLDRMLHTADNKSGKERDNEEKEVAHE